MTAGLTAFRVAVDAGVPRLDQACEAISRVDDPAVAAGSVVAALDRLAGRAQRDAVGDAEALVGWLRDAAGLRGNMAAYYEVDNSYVDRVLARRLGIPISLSVVLIEAGRRLGLAIDGVGYPGHFLARTTAGGQTLYLDPFAGRVYHHQQEVLERYALPDEAANAGVWLAAVTGRQILSRMLANLKAVYGRLEDFPRLERTIDLLLILTPWSFDERRDRGLVRQLRGDQSGAIDDFRTYLEFRGDAADAGMVRMRLGLLGEAVE